MSGQINITKGSAFSNPPNNMLGIGYDLNGNLVRINANGSTTILIPEAIDIVGNMIANKGVGLLADLPTSYVEGDIYVTSDSFDIYTAVSTDTWGAVPLKNLQFVTDTSKSSWMLYQFDTAELKIIGDTAVQTSFSDSVFSLYNTADVTKLVDFLLSGLTTGQTRTLTIPDISGLLAVAGMPDAFKFAGQVTGGHAVKSFSAVASFDLDEGNSQKMILTGNLTSVNITNPVDGGSYLIYLTQDSTGGRTIPALGASFGTVIAAPITFLTDANDVNIINVNVDPSGDIFTTVTTTT